LPAVPQPSRVIHTGSIFRAAAMVVRSGNPGMIMPRKAMVAAISVVTMFSGAVTLYMFALPGFSSARPQPPGMEVAVATWLLRHSVPATAAPKVAAAVMVSRRDRRDRVVIVQPRASSILSSAALNPVASFATSSFAQKCMKNRRGVSLSM
jgi:hypothetical protein